MQRLRERAGDERGMTLIELLVATVLGLMVIGAATTVFVSGIKSQPRAASHASAVQTAQTTMDRMTRELRQGSSVVSATATQLAMVTYVDSATCGGADAATAISCRVTYNCATNACTRTVSQPNGSSPGPPTTVVTGLASTSVFSYVPNSAGSSACSAPGTGSPSYVCVKLVVNDSKGHNQITLTDGVGLRNS